MVTVGRPSAQSITDAATACTKKFSRFGVWMAIDTATGESRLFVLPAKSKTASLTPEHVHGFVFKKVAMISKRRSCGIEPAEYLARIIRDKAEGSVDYMNTPSGQRLLGRMAERACLRPRRGAVPAPAAALGRA